MASAVASERESPAYVVRHLNEQYEKVSNVPADPVGTGEMLDRPCMHAPWL